ncbi:MAG: hypothetical protein ACK41Y_16785, partial [Paracoccus hibiscisoli]|uniref:hypothetical protein n=1 Tax=Paracoccus hibiscisoli TaxID=2023261 RepID=UPI00391993A3
GFESDSSEWWSQPAPSAIADTEEEEEEEEDDDAAAGGAMEAAETNAAYGESAPADVTPDPAPLDKPADVADAAAVRVPQLDPNEAAVRRGLSAGRPRSSGRRRRRAKARLRVGDAARLPAVAYPEQPLAQTLFQGDRRGGGHVFAILCALLEENIRRALRLPRSAMRVNAVVVDALA